MSYRGRLGQSLWLVVRWNAENLMGIEYWITRRIEEEGKKKGRRGEKG